jgi:hypothetical protein
LPAQRDKFGPSEAHMTFVSAFAEKAVQSRTRCAHSTWLRRKQGGLPISRLHCQERDERERKKSEIEKRGSIPHKSHPHFTHTDTDTRFRHIDRRPSLPRKTTEPLPHAVIFIPLSLSLPRSSLFSNFLWNPSPNGAFHFKHSFSYFCYFWCSQKPVLRQY